MVNQAVNFPWLSFSWQIKIDTHILTIGYNIYKSIMSIKKSFLRNLHQVVFVIYVNITLYIISFFIGLTFSLLNKIGRIE